jgi:hypothetical protein
MCPPKLTTICPAVCESKSTLAVLSDVNCIEAGRISVLLVSYTATFTLYELKLCSTVIDPVAENVSLTEATCPIFKLVSPEPSPEKSDAETIPVPKSTELFDSNVSTWLEEDTIPCGIEPSS